MSSTFNPPDLKHTVRTCLIQADYFKSLPTSLKSVSGTSAVSDCNEVNLFPKRSFKTQALNYHIYITQEIEVIPEAANFVTGRMKIS